MVRGPHGCARHNAAESAETHTPEASRGLQRNARQRRAEALRSLWIRARRWTDATPRRLLRWFAFWGSSGAGNEVSHAFLRPRIVEGIVQVLWSASGGVMEKHALNAGGPFENHANKSSPHPHSRVERRPNWFTHPERLSHCSEIGWNKLGWLRGMRWVAERSAAFVLSHRLFPKGGSRRRGSLRRASIPRQKLREHERDGKKTTDKRD